MAITLDGTNGILSPDFEPSSSTTPTNGLFLPAANAVGFATGSTERLRIDSSGNVGIGTSSPGVRLEVKSTTTNTARMRVTGTGSTAGNYRGYEFADNSGFSGGLFQDESTNNFQFWNYGASIMTLTNSGNLGLGVTPSAWSSSWKAFQFGSVGAAFSNSSNAIWSGNEYLNTGGTPTYITSQYALRYRQDVGSGYHAWFTSASGTAGNAISWTQAMTLDASGNLGIGTASPSFALDIATALANIRLASSTGTNSCLLRLTNTGGTAYIGLDNSSGGVAAPYALSMYHGGAYPITFSTSGTERARIDSSGNLLVGTTNSSITAGNGIKVNADNRLSVVNGGSVEGFIYYNSAVSAYRFYVSPNGTISATSTTITAISDQRLKENIRDLDDGLSTILALKPRKFDWKEGKGKDIKDDRGFIAQEFEQVFPDLIDTWKDPAPEGEEPYKSVRPDLIPIMVKAIQELTARLEALENK